MGQGATKRTKPRFITLTVLELLKEETDATRPLHISEIVQRLKWGGIDTNRDTVRRVLKEERVSKRERHDGGLPIQWLRLGWA